MSALAGRRILLGVTGGIAAYKSAYLLRLLREAGAEVRVVMTQAAGAFITPLTLQALSGNPVRQGLLDAQAEAGMDHIELARWADLVLVAPATAATMARLANGFADDLLSTLCLATEAPLVLCPAMNRVMWRHPATQANVETLRQRQVVVLGPAQGEQACGEIGPGRMLEPESIVEALQDGSGTREGVLSGVEVLMTAGPTREPLDPVRFISNRSSGRMGYALATAMRELGASVSLVSGPVELPAPRGVELIRVETALQMHAQVMRLCGQAGIFVATAAVADYRMSEAHAQKIKKSAEVLEFSLVRNPDILADVAALGAGPFTVGFAAETERVEEYALDKLRRKGLDMIAANQVGGRQGGFERADNALTVLWRDGREDLPMMPKTQLARRLAAIISERYHKRNST